MEEYIQHHLKKMEQTAPDFWNVSPEVAKLLYILAKAKNATRILELGTSNGYSTIWLALAAKETDGKVISIEFFQERFDLANENLKTCNLQAYTTLYQGKIQKILPSFNNYFDFIFIDACKEEYHDYILELERLTQKGTVIIADNVVSHRDKMLPFIDYMTKTLFYDCVTLNIDNGLMICYRR
jgi:predicted O-methyltransferase YrrM